MPALKTELILVETWHGTDDRWGIGDSKALFIPSRILGTLLVWHPTCKALSRLQRNRIWCLCFSKTTRWTSTVRSGRGQGGISERENSRSLLSMLSIRILSCCGGNGLMHSQHSSHFRKLLFARRASETMLEHVFNISAPLCVGLSRNTRELQYLYLPEHDQRRPCRA